LVGEGEDLLLVTLVNHFLDRDEVALQVQVPPGRRLALAYDATARCRCAVEGTGTAARVRVGLNGEAVVVVALRYAPAP
jgi:hypothetical protein